VTFAVRGRLLYRVSLLENTKQAAVDVVIILGASLKPIGSGGGVMTVQETSTQVFTLPDLSGSRIESTYELVGSQSGETLHVVFRVRDHELAVERMRVCPGL